jgi:small subunit ribosomal protein S18
MEETKATPTGAGPSAPAGRTSSDSRGRNGTSQGRRPGRFQGPRPPRVCPFCAQKAKTIDYKNVEMLRRYLTDHGKIKPRRKVGTCARHQRVLSAAIKRARHVALLPFVSEATRGE